MEFTEFEHRVLREACARDPNSRLALAQLASAKFERRDRTGHGLFVYFSVDQGLDSLPTDGRILVGSQQMSLLHPGLGHGADIIVWAEEGYIDCLETCVFGTEPWPDDSEKLFRINGAVN